MREVLWKSTLLAAAAIFIVAGGAGRTNRVQAEFFADLDESVDDDDVVDFEEEMPQNTASNKAAPTPDLPVSSSDSVTTIAGSRLYGKVITAEKDGSLRLTGPQFGGEVRINVAALDRVWLKGAEGKPGKTEVHLLGGDFILGDLVSVTPEVVLIDTQAAGRITVPKKAVRSVNLGKSSGVLLENDFALGDMASWAAKKGVWNLTDGAIVCESRGAGNLIYAKLPQSESVTMVARVRSLSDEPVHCDLVLFADKAGPVDSSGRSYGASSVVASISDGSWSMTTTSADGGSGSSGSLRSPASGGTIRFSYEPSSGGSRLWMDSRSVFDRKNGPQVSSGRFVALCASAPLRIEYVAVLRGIVPPSSETEADGATPAGKTEVEFANGDHLTADDILLADGQFTVTTSYGQVRCPAGSVRRIVFGGGKSTPPARPQKGDVRVTTVSGRLTLRFEGLAADNLIGHSDCLGDLTLRRSGVRETKFNLAR